MQDCIIIKTGDKMRELTHESAQSMIVEIDSHIKELEKILDEMKSTRHFIARFIE